MRIATAGWRLRFEQEYENIVVSAFVVMPILILSVVVPSDRLRWLIPDYDKYPCVLLVTGIESDTKDIFC